MLHTVNARQELTRRKYGLDAALALHCFSQALLVHAQLVLCLMAAFLHDVGQIQGVPLPKIGQIAGQVNACTETLLSALLLYHHCTTFWTASDGGNLTP